MDINNEQIFLHLVNQTILVAFNVLSAQKATSDQN